MTAPLRDVLLVEDNPADVRLTEEALRDGGLRLNLHVVADGEAALRFLRREGPEHSSGPRPDLVLLDLNLPRKDGREVLREVKADADLKTIPVVVLTTSRSEQDVQQAYALHANCYVTKPLDYGRFTGVVKTIEAFWSMVARLPPRDGLADA